MIPVYRDGEKCTAEQGIHFHFAKSEWVRLPNVKVVQQFVYVSVHDPARGLWEQLTIPVEAPADDPVSRLQRVHSIHGTQQRTR